MTLEDTEREKVVVFSYKYKQSKDTMNPLHDTELKALKKIFCLYSCIVYSRKKVRTKWRISYKEDFIICIIHLIMLEVQYYTMENDMGEI
jgi:hypothetical protein